jgi:hypothetical protein
MANDGMVGIAYYSKKDVAVTMYRWDRFAAGMAIEEIQETVRMVHDETVEVEVGDLQFFRLGEKMQPILRTQVLGFLGEQAEE